MAIALNDRESSQNESFLNELQQTLLAKNLLLSDSVKAILLAETKKSGIWFPGLSPAVFQEFITCVTLLLGNTDSKQSDTEKAKLMLRSLHHHLTLENNLIRQKYASNAGRVLQDEKQGPILHLRDHIERASAHGNTVPDTYWLKSADIIALTDPINRLPGYHAIMPTDDAAAAHNTASSLINQGKKKVFVFEESKGHWTLTTYRQGSHTNEVVKEAYNPPGNGKCGDHCIAKAYQQIEVPTPYPAGVTAASSGPEVRQASINMLKAGLNLNVSAKSNENGSSTNNAQEHKRPTRLRWQSAKPASTKANHSSTTVTPTKFESDLERLSTNLTYQANALIDSLVNLSDSEKAKKWQEFDLTHWKKFEGLANSSTTKFSGYSHLFRLPKEKTSPTVDTSSQQPNLPVKKLGN